MGDGHLDIEIEKASIETAKAIKTEQEAEKPRVGIRTVKEALGTVLGFIGFIVVVWLLFWIADCTHGFYDDMWGKPSRPYFQTPQTNVEVLVGAITSAMPRAWPRIDYFEGGNVDIFINRHDYESIPFPDRENAVNGICTAWLAKTDQSHFPSLRMRDIRTGETLVYYNPSFHRLTISKVN